MEHKHENNDMTPVEIKEHRQKVSDSIDLSGVNPEERWEVQQLITKKADIFSIIHSDFGNITPTQMEMKLQDMTPAQLT